MCWAGPSLVKKLPCFWIRVGSALGQHTNLDTFGWLYDVVYQLKDGQRIFVPNSVSLCCIPFHTNLDTFSRELMTTSVILERIVGEVLA